MDAAELTEWLRARLDSEAGRRDFRDLLAGGVEAVLAAPVRALLPEPAVASALDVVLASEARIDALSRAAVRLALASALEEARGDGEPIGRFLDAEARQRLEAFAMRSSLVDESWIDVLFSQAATEELFAETLFRALQDFSEGLPSLVQSVTPSAFGRLATALGGATEGVRGRVMEGMAKRLEPEIRRFVQRATRGLLVRTAAFVKSGLDREESREARRNLLRHALSKSAASYAQLLDAQALEDIEATLAASLKNPAAQGELRARVRDAHRRLLDAFGDRSLEAALAAHGIEVELDVDALTEATWPLVRVALASERAGAVVARLAVEILERTGRSSPQ